MKRVLTFVAVLSLLTISAFAADGGAGSINLGSSVKVGSTELPQGNYKVSWTGTGDSAQVTLKQGKFTATVPAQVVDAKHGQNAYSTKSVDGGRVLTEIQLKDKTLVFGSTDSAIAGR